MGYCCKNCGKIIGSIVVMGKGRKAIEKPACEPTDLCKDSDNGRHKWRRIMTDCPMIKNT